MHPLEPGKPVERELLETIREYVLEKLSESGELVARQRAHASRTLGSVRRCSSRQPWQVLTPRSRPRAGRYMRALRTPLNTPLPAARQALPL